MTDVNDLARLAAKRAKETLGEAVAATQALAEAIASETRAKTAQATARAQLRHAVAAAAALGFTDTDLHDLGINTDAISGRRRAEPASSTHPNQQADQQLA